jgi:hypothetical protein
MKEVSIGAAHLRENQLYFFIWPIAVFQQICKFIDHQFRFILWIENIECILQLLFIVIGRDPVFMHQGQEINEREVLVRLRIYTSMRDKDVFVERI